MFGTFPGQSAIIAGSTSTNTKVISEQYAVTMSLEEHDDY